MAGRSSCPQCGTILRIRDRSFVGRKVLCPDCKTPLHIESIDDQGDFVVNQLIESKSGAHRKATIPVGDKKPVPSTKVQSFITRTIYSPLTAAWLLAIAISSLVAVLTLTPKFRFANARLVPVRTQTEIVPEHVPASGDSLVNEQQSPPTSPPDEPRETVADERWVSALEPANVDGSIPWHPPMQMADVIPELPPEPPPVRIKIDVESKLNQEFEKYAQPKIRRRDLLEALQEQLDAPIRFDVQELGITGLDETVAFDLSNTTLRQIIQATIDPAGWEISVEDTGIRLKPKQKTPSPESSER